METKLKLKSQKFSNHLDADKALGLETCKFHLMNMMKITFFDFIRYITTITLKFGYKRYFKEHIV